MILRFFDQEIKKHSPLIPSPKNSYSPWKWLVRRQTFPFGKAYFQGRTVSFRECKYFLKNFPETPPKKKWWNKPPSSKGMDLSMSSSWAWISKGGFPVKCHQLPIVWDLFQGRAPPKVFKERRPGNPTMGNTVDARKSCTSWYGSLSYYWKGFIHPRWCKILSINRTIFLDLGTLVNKIHLREKYRSCAWLGDMGQFPRENMLQGVGFTTLRDYPRQ